MILAFQRVASLEARCRVKLILGNTAPQAGCATRRKPGRTYRQGLRWPRPEQAPALRVRRGPPSGVQSQAAAAFRRKLARDIVSYGLPYPDGAEVERLGLVINPPEASVRQMSGSELPHSTGASSTDGRGAHSRSRTFLCPTERIANLKCLKSASPGSGSV